MARGIIDASDPEDEALRISRQQREGERNVEGRCRGAACPAERHPLLYKAGGVRACAEF